MTNITRLIQPVQQHSTIPASQVPSAETLKNLNLTFGDASGEALVTFCPETDSGKILVKFS